MENSIKNDLFYKLLVRTQEGAVRVKLLVRTQARRGLFFALLCALHGQRIKRSLVPTVSCEDSMAAEWKWQVLLSS
jgi:hypothetical protein